MADQQAQQAAAAKKKKLLNGTNIEYRYPSGSVYVGGFKEGKLHGYGVYKYHPSGDEYEGEWLTDMKHGHGTYTYDGGDRYVGEWRAGKKFGKGTYVFTTGDEYIGHWKEDKIHGFGTFTIARNGNKYEGNWEESYRHGHGVLMSGNGDCYDGDWQRGKEEGLGILKYANGNAYVGSWKGGQMDGKGIFTEKNQKHLVEHIAGYLITKTEIDEKATVDADWQAADRLYNTFKRKLEKNGGVDIVGGGTQASSADLIKATMEKEQWKKRYEDLLQQKTSSLSKDAGNDVGLLKEQIAALRLANDAESKRADDAASKAKLLEAELKETRLKAEAASTSASGPGGGGGASTQEVEDLQRQVADLTKELELRRPKGGSEDDPVEMKVKLELAEGELRNLRESREQAYKLREQNMESMRNIQRLEQRNEELLKEMNVLRARSSNLQGQIAEDQSKQYNELSAEIRRLQEDLTKAQKAKAEAEEKFNRAKRLEEMNNLKLKRVDELEDENKRLRSGRVTDSDLNKNLDKKNEQLDSLRRQNAELQRQVDELQYDLNMAGAAQNGADGASPGGKKKKKGAVADNSAPAAEAIDPEVLKKEKKKLKKVVGERDALAQELYEEQVVSTRLSRVLENLRGRVAVVAALYNGSSEDSPNLPIRINQENPAEILTEASSGPQPPINDEDNDGGKKKKKKGKSSGIEFDACVEGPEAAKDVFVELQKSLVMAAYGFHTSVISLGPMGGGKSKIMNALIPSALKALFETVDEQKKNSLASFNTVIRVSMLEACSSGVFDLASGSEIMSVMRNMDTLESVAVGELLTTVTTAKETIKKVEELKTKRKSPRSHLFTRVTMEFKHKVLNLTKSGRLTFVDLCGQGSLADQQDVESGRYINQTSATVVSILDNLVKTSSEESISGTMPFDSSPFAMLLAGVLGGNCMTNIIACINASNSETSADSVAALHLASRARQIYNRPVLQLHQTPDVLRMRALITESMSSEQATANLQDVPNDRM